MTVAPDTVNETTKQSRRVGMFTPALVAIACFAACSLPLLGAAFAAGLGAYVLGIPTWTYLVAAAITVAAIVARRRNRTSKAACGSCEKGRISVAAG